jgi:hypothetical protein
MGGYPAFLMDQKTPNKNPQISDSARLSTGRIQERENAQ